MLVHHKGDGDKFFHGSTAIKDQADALFAVLRDDDERCRLKCSGGRGKMRRRRVASAVNPLAQPSRLRILPHRGGFAGRPVDG